MSRIDKGFALYQKGNVSISSADDEEIQFEVLSNGTPYIVVMDLKMGSIKCVECEDWSYRYGDAVNVMASFLCKHCYAAMFKLGDIKGVGKQSKLMEIKRIDGKDIMKKGDCDE